MSGKYPPQRVLKAAEWAEEFARQQTEGAKARGLRMIADMLRGSVHDETAPDLFGETGTDGKGQVEAIVELWNRTVSKTPVPLVQRIGPKLRKKIAARLKGWPQMGTFEILFRYVAQNPWFRGEDPKSNGWRGDLKWLMDNEDRFQQQIDRAMSVKTSRQAERVAGCKHHPPCTDRVSCTSKLLSEEA